MALKGLLNPLIKEKTKLTYEQQENISEYWIFVVPFLRLFFQGIMNDDKSKVFLKALAQCDKNIFREIVNLFVIWFFYNLDRIVLRGVNDLFDEQKLRTYLVKIWFVDYVNLREITDLLDNTKLEERQQVFCKLIFEKLNNHELLGTLMVVFVSAHMFGNLKIVLSLDEDKLTKISF